MTKEMEGEVKEIEGKKTDKGKHYKRIRVDSKWGSFWGNKDLEVGDKVEAKYEDVKDGQFTNWKSFTPLAQDDEKDEESNNSSKSTGNSKYKDAKKRFEIRKQVALKAAAKTTENPTIGEIRKLYMTYVNLLSKRPDEFEDLEEEED